MKNSFDLSASAMKYRPTDSGAVAKDQLSALRAHVIFTTASQRPLRSDEIETYLEVRRKIALLTLAKQSATRLPPLQKRVATGAFDL
jgi:hypothetical protein